MCCQISDLFTRAHVCVAGCDLITGAVVLFASYVITSLQQAYILRDIWFDHKNRLCVGVMWVHHYSSRMCCEVSELFTRPCVCVANYLSCSIERRMFCEITDLFNRGGICVARYLSWTLGQKYVLRDIWVYNWCIRICCEIFDFFTTADLCCEIAELFTTADVSVARYLICSVQQTYVLRDIWVVLHSRIMRCEISDLFISAHLCVARYPSGSLEQTYVLRDIWVVQQSRRNCC